MGYQITVQLPTLWDHFNFLKYASNRKGLHLNRKNITKVSLFMGVLKCLGLEGAQKVNFSWFNCKVWDLLLIQKFVRRNKSIKCKIVNVQIFKETANLTAYSSSVEKVWRRKILSADKLLQKMFN